MGFKLFSIKKISYKFISATLITLFILFSLFTYYLIYDQKGKEYSQLNEEVLRSAELLALTSEEPIWKFNTIALEKNVKSFFKDKRVVRISIKDSTGEELVNLERENKGSKTITESKKVVRDGEDLGEVEIRLTNYYLEKNLSQIRNQLIVAIVIICILIAIIITFISSSITEPVIAAKNFAREIADGNLNVAKLEVNTEDEVGSLITALDNMRDNLHNIVRNVLDSVEDLSAYSEELSASAEEEDAVIETTMESLEEITSNIQQISSGAFEVTSHAKEANSQSEIGEENIRRTIVSIEEIDEVATETVSIINQLDNKAQEITKVVDLITNIAEQTNLLALNAAIEAARAGEAGQGFAVVADEIRELAEETTNATAEINDLVNLIQGKSEEGLRAVKQVEVKANEGNKVVRETRNSFSKIKDAIDGTSAYIKQTSVSTENLAQNSSLINKGSGEIKSMSKEIANSSHELAERAENLRNLITEFEI